jgi:hypothetical protein
MWDNYKPRRYQTLPIPATLNEAMNRYSAETGKRKSHIFDRAIFMLMEMWDDWKFDEVERALTYNPPPQCKKTSPLSIRFTGQESYDWVCYLERDKAIIGSTRDFILRALSWYLRENGALEKHDAHLIKTD